ETKYPLAQKCWPVKLRAINTGQMDSALAFNIADHLRDRIFRRDRDHHVNVIRHQMAFLDSAFLLHRQLAKRFPEMLSQLPVKRLPAVLGNEHYMVFALPFAVA